MRPGQYQIRLIQYFDEAQNQNPGPDPQVQVYIYRASDDSLMAIQVLPFLIQQSVAYTNEECSIQELQTSRVVWSGDVSLDPQLYDDPEGYYIVWERCCRNSSIVNVVNPIATGMTYLTRIPPLWQNEAPFINSSPSLFQPLSDYACQNQLYYIAFTGTDPDGDQLVYSLAQPLNSSASVAVPIPKPDSLHFPVAFDQNKGYSAENMIPGAPKLAISSRGLLTVNPSREGLHVFSVLVEEFRDNVKLGQVQRDFQMLVLPAIDCSPPDPPQVAVKIPGNPFFQESVDTLKYAFNEEKCFEFVVKNITPGETLTLRAEGVNFDGDINEIFSFNQFLVGEKRDSLIVEVCAPDCPPLGNMPFIVDLIAGDNACPLPQLDTVRLVMIVEPLPNSLPVTTLQDNRIVLSEGSIYESAFTVTDADLDSLYVEISTPGVRDPGIYGFESIIVSNEPGRYEGIFRWDTSCEKYEFELQQRFFVKVRADDGDYCLFDNPNFNLLDMNVILPSNSLPEVFVKDAPLEGLISPINQQIEFEVEGIDPEGDFLTLGMLGDGFNPAAFGASLSEGSGLGTATSTFTWFADCNFTFPGEDNSFTFLFFAADQEFCDAGGADTIRYTIQLDIPDNEKPVISPQQTYVLEVNEPFELAIEAVDLDPNDEITLSFFNGERLPSSPSLRFDPVSGTGRVTGMLSWVPECDLLAGSKSADYSLVFQVRDDFCPVIAQDTLRFNFQIVETRDRFEGFLPPNAFSPNGDALNEQFRLSDSNDPALNLPIDNCNDAFEYISIHNRAGRSVFYSEERDFTWDGGDFSSGVYFYVIKYTKTEYKNYLQLLR
ncbi:MAG: hypothetical protein ACI9DM_000327 [Cyclobacteriaceae bacterium]